MQLPQCIINASMIHILSTPHDTLSVGNEKRQVNSTYKFKKRGIIGIVTKKTREEWNVTHVLHNYFNLIRALIINKPLAQCL